MSEIYSILKTEHRVFVSHRNREVRGMAEEPHSHGAAQSCVDTADMLGFPGLSWDPHTAVTNGGILSVPASFGVLLSLTEKPHNS